MVGIEKAKRFRHPALQIGAVRLKRLHPPDIDIPQIHRRVAAVHPFGQHHAGPACRLDADRVEPGGNEEILQLRRLAKDIAVIRGKALRTVEEGLDAGFGKHRKTFHRLFKDRLEMVEILRQGVKLEILGYAVHAPRLGIRLESTKKNLASIFLVIGTFIRHPQHRQVRGQPVDPLGDNIEMLTGMKRHGDAGLGPDLARPHAAGIDNIIGFDRTLIGHHTGGAAVCLMDIGDFHTLDDLHP